MSIRLWDFWEQRGSNCSIWLNFLIENPYRIHSMQTWRNTFRDCWTRIRICRLVLRRSRRCWWFWKSPNVSSCRLFEAFHSNFIHFCSWHCSGVAFYHSVSGEGDAKYKSSDHCRSFGQWTLFPLHHIGQIWWQNGRRVQGNYAASW